MAVWALDVLLALFAWQGIPCAALAETVFLKSGRTIQAESVEIIGDRVRIATPVGRIDLHRTEVLTIHTSSPPSVSAGPADVYRDTTQQMNEKVRREIQQAPRGTVVR